MIHFVRVILHDFGGCVGKASCFFKMILLSICFQMELDDRHYSMWCEIKAAHHHLRHIIICQQFLSDLSLLHLSEQT